ncbi:extracellular solute-binding protein [Melioribacteraceae bacterium 4301-Me]|uniref:extracellular solute-binding protein n=1 Tax=Pyranulibacter aquaticus TaxID=3163344 RepID=UPI00359A6DCD
MKKFYLYLIGVTVVALVVFFTLTYLGNPFLYSREGPVKLYFVDNISPAHKKIIDAFNELYKGKIEVVPINLPFEKFSTNERKELLIRFLRSRNDRIDIFSVDQIWVPRFTKWTEPLRNYFSINERNAILDPALQSCIYNNQLVAIPLYFDISVMYYRYDIISNLPDFSKIKSEIDSSITWSRFIELYQKYFKNCKQPYYLFAADNYEGLMCSFVEMVASQNNELFVNDSVKLNTPQSKRALSMLFDMINKYSMAPKYVTAYKETDCKEEFLKKEGIFLRSWPGNLKNDITADLHNKIKMAPLPHFQNGKAASVIGGWDLMISKYSTKKSEAIEFIKFILKESTQKIFLEESGYLPVLKDIYDNKNFLIEYPELKFYKRLIKTSVRRPFLEKYTLYSDVISYYLNLALKKQISIDSALSKAEHIINSNELFIK